MSRTIDISTEVREALEVGAPVVALESTVIAHGLPPPHNREAALAMEQAVRHHGAVPATIAVLDGKVRVGLDAQEIERLAREEHVQKVSRRDLPGVLAAGRTGATTVAATMLCAARAGIRIQATGGIGGVHRGGESSLDVSADLAVLARTPVVLVSSGAKAVLDLGRTLEVLETLGVPVIGYGTDHFPAFWCRASPHRLEHRADTPAEVTRIIRSWRDLAPDAGLLVTNPVAREHALDPDDVEVHIRAACARAAEKDVTGKRLTPFLLAELSRRTGGATLEANKTLLGDNAALAAEIAVSVDAGC